jgi:D-alanyl-lipoteichoic acid acyltransferase DltB (MBOAT superfamily)
MLPQFRTSRDPDYGMIVAGLKLMLWGYFMKLVVADRVGIYVDAVYHNISEHNGTTLLFTAFLYPFQVYADLGGYSLVAIGTASILGYRVMHNFRRPFFATSMAEFWRRWHISLISWLTDYVYTPLNFAFRKYRAWGVVIALLITFLISGIWHGASLTFVIWGLMQGIFVSIEALTAKRRGNFATRFRLRGRAGYIAAGCVITFILFASSQVFARAVSVDDAMLFYERLFTTSGTLFIGVPSILIFGLFGIVLLMLKDFTDEYYPGKFLLFENRYRPVRILAYSSVILLIFLIGVFDGGEFIYFQF